MSVTVRHIADFIESLAPAALKLSYDNVGLQAGIYTDTVSAILTTLDVTEEVINEAVEKGINLIISHHPVIFPSISAINDTTESGRLLLKLIQNKIHLLVAHTNLDAVKGGVSFVLAEKLGLESVEILGESEITVSRLVFRTQQKRKDHVFTLMNSHRDLIQTYSVSQEGEELFIELFCDTPHVKTIRSLFGSSVVDFTFDYPVQAKSKQYGFGAIGQLSEGEMNQNTFFQFVSSKLGVNSFRYSGSKEKIRTVAVCGGSGKSLIKSALSKKADAFITADITYHDYFIPSDSMLLMDIGHYETEHFIADSLAIKVQLKFDTIPVFRSGVQTNPMKTYIEESRL